MEFIALSILARTLATDEAELRALDLEVTALGDDLALRFGAPRSAMRQ